MVSMATEVGVELIMLHQSHFMQQRRYRGTFCPLCASDAACEEREYIF